MLLDGKPTSWHPKKFLSGATLPFRVQRDRSRCDYTDPLASQRTWLFPVWFSCTAADGFLATSIRMTDSVAGLPTRRVAA